MGKISRTAAGRAVTLTIVKQVSDFSFVPPFFQLSFRLHGCCWSKCFQPLFIMQLFFCQIVFCHLPLSYPFLNHLSKPQCTLKMGLQWVSEGQVLCDSNRREEVGGDMEVFAGHSPQYVMIKERSGAKQHLELRLLSWCKHEHNLHCCGYMTQIKDHFCHSAEQPTCVSAGFLFELKCISFAKSVDGTLMSISGR